MIKFKWIEGHQPEYKTQWSTGADLSSTREVVIQPQQAILVPVGVWIDECADLLDIQVRARSSLFRKFNCILANGVGTIDTDYRDEIEVPLCNLGSDYVRIPANTALAQLVVAECIDIPQFARSGMARLGGFGSTDRDGREL
jgi:dUTP pyrophosphatase